MSSALSQLYLPKRSLRLACALSLFIALIQSSVFFGISGSFANVLSGGPGKLLISLLAFTSAMGAWAIMASSVVQNRNQKGFVSQLPVSGKQIHQTRLRSDLITIFLPIGICLIFLIGAASFRGIGLTVTVVGLDLICGLLLGLAIFERPIVGKGSSQKKKLLSLFLGFSSVIFVVAVGSIYLTLFCGGVSFWLLHQSWNQHSATTEIAPLALRGIEGQSPKSTSRSGSAILNRWILRHTLFRKSIFAVGLLTSVFIFLETHNLDYSESSRFPMKLYFLGAMVFGAGFVAKKMDGLPVSKAKLFRFISLPALGFIAFGVVSGEALHLSGLVAEYEGLEDELPIRYTFDKSLIGEGSTQQLKVPPHMLELSSADRPAMAEGPKGEFYPAAKLSVLWGYGPSLYNPFYVPEVPGGVDKLEPALLSFQLERALTEFYGASLPAKEIRSRFIEEHKDGTSFFKKREFNAWQTEWASDHSGAFLTQSEIWHLSHRQLLPAQAIAWLIGWGFAVAMALWLRVPISGRKLKALSSGLWMTVVGGVFFILMDGPSFLGGFVHTEGFDQKLRMFPTETLRSFLPDHLTLAWLVVIPVFLALYQALFALYKKTEWSDLQPRNSMGQKGYEAWKKL